MILNINLFLEIKHMCDILYGDMRDGCVVLLMLFNGCETHEVGQNLHVYI